MSGPRNIPGYERGQANRDVIKAIMLEHASNHPLRRSLTGKQIQARLTHLALSTVLWHMAAIHAEADTTAARSVGIFPIYPSTQAPHIGATVRDDFARLSPEFHDQTEAASGPSEG